MKTLRFPLSCDLRSAVAVCIALLVTYLLGGFESQDGVSQAGNTLLTISMITKEALRILENNLAFTKRVNRQYDDKFAIDGAKIGYTVNARKPVRYVANTGQALQLQDATETSVPVTLTTQAQVAFQFSSADLALSVDDFKDRFLQPAIVTMANKIDFDGLQLYNQVANLVGTPGTVPNALYTYLSAGVLLNNNAAPLDDMRHLVITPEMEATIVDALKGLFQQASSIASQYVKGQMGIAAGFNWAMDQNCATHTVGPLGGTPVVNGASQTGSSLVTNAWTAAAANRLKRGDVFTIGSGATGCYAVNPQNRQSTGKLAQFVVTADVASDASGNATIPIWPPIITSGAYQTVVAAPSNSATINVIGAANTATPQGMAFHRDAFTLVTADLPVPGGVDRASRVADKQLGISLRMIRQYDITTDQWPCRIDVLYGWASLRPELACRIAA